MAAKKGKEMESAVLEKGDGSLASLRTERRIESTVKDKSHGLEEQVSFLFGKLNLTAKEKETLVLEDTEDSEVPVAKHAVIGKVLAPSLLHLQTIMSAMRPAWGNPRGLEARMVGDNLFIIEFESELDKNRVLEGSPWFIGRGRQAVILQDFNYDLRPSDVTFDEMAIWVNILNLPLGLRNEKWGFELAAKIGKKVLKIDVDEQKKAVGKELRARVIISLKEPLPRGVSVFSSRRQRKEWYDVVYERVPYFCFSCGIIGHSELECPSPGIRDDRGYLPYSEKLRALEERRLKNIGEWYGQGDRLSGRSNSVGVRGIVESKRLFSRNNEDDDKSYSEGEGGEGGNVVYSPAQNQMSRNDDISLRDGRCEDFTADTMLSKKRKSDESLFKCDSGVEELNIMEVEGSSMGLVPVTQRGFNLTTEEGDIEVDDGFKKFKKGNAGLPE